MGQSDEDVEMAVKMFEAMTEAVQKVRKNVGKAGYTAEKINRELSRTMFGSSMKEMFGAEWGR